MTPEAIRQLYDYHFTINRKVWDACIAPLSEEQYTRELGYSVGSIRNQMVHLMSVEARWFGGLVGAEVPDHANPEDYPNRAALRARWDAVENQMRAYLAGLSEEEANREFRPGMLVWQVLVHVVNHATDHRAQILLALNQMGVETFAQDYFYYLMGRM